ncbi:MAG: type II toxin-antitoxin system HicB family antitoxin [Bacteroidales bacterium]|nr:type II toxin-antitoxin system HicB family antitoxin [Bacteroidales bacterium]
MKLVYQAVFYKCKEGGYTVEFPDLPGCTTQGDDIADALDMAEYAASGWLLSTIEDGGVVPKSTTNMHLSSFDGAEFINLVMVDLEKYSKLYSKNAIKKTLTIPKWLNTLAEKKNINFSQVLQKALKAELGLNYDNK